MPDAKSMARAKGILDEISIRYVHDDDIQLAVARAFEEQRREIIQVLVNAVSADLGPEPQPYVDQIVYNATVKERQRAINAVKAVSLPAGYRWGRDACEHFEFGKECAVAAIRAGE